MAEIRRSLHDLTWEEWVRYEWRSIIDSESLSYEPFNAVPRYIRGMERSPASAHQATQEWESFRRAWAGTEHEKDA